MSDRPGLSFHRCIYTNTQGLEDVSGCFARDPVILVGPGLITMTSPQVKSVVRIVLNLQLESLSIANAQFVLKHVQELFELTMDMGNYYLTEMRLQS